MRGHFMAGPFQLVTRNPKAGAGRIRIRLERFDAVASRVLTLISLLMATATLMAAPSAAAVSPDATISCTPGASNASTSGNLLRDTQDDVSSDWLRVTNAGVGDTITFSIEQSGNPAVSGGVNPSVGTYSFTNNQSGSKSFTTTVTSAGTKDFTITITNNNVNTSRSITWGATCIPKKKTTSTTGSNATSVHSASSVPVTLSATVTSSGTTVTSGSVMFTVLDGATVIGTAVSDDVSSGTASAIYSLPAGTAAKTYTIKTDYGGSSAFEASTSSAATLTVGKANQTITFTAPPTQIYASGKLVDLGATASSNLPVTYTSGTPSVCTISGGSALLTGPGQCTVTARQSGDTNWRSASNVTRSFIVLAELKITTASPMFNGIVGSSLGDLIEASGGNGVYASWAVTSGSVPPGLTFVKKGNAAGLDGVATTAGTYTFTVQVTDNLGFTASKSMQLTIKALPVVTTSSPLPGGTVGEAYSQTFAAAEGYYGGPYTFVLAAGSTLPDGLTLSAAGVLSGTPQHADTYNFSVIAKEFSRESAPKPFALTIAKGAQAITFTSASPTGAVYGGSYSATATGGGSDIPVTFSAGAGSTACSVGSSGTVAFTGVGPCVVAADQAGNADYEAADQVTQTFSVAKAPQSVTFTPPLGQTFALNANVPLTASATSLLTVAFASSSPDVCTVSGANAVIKAAGTCQIVASQEGDGNFAPAESVSGSFVIGQAAQTITFTSTAPSAAVYGGSYTAAATGGGSGNAVTFKVGTGSAGCSVGSGGAVTFTGTGTCIVEANQDGDANFAAAEAKTQSFTISKAAQSISFTAPDGQTYAPSRSVALSASATSGLETSFSSSTPDVCTISGTNAIVVAAGSCSVTASQDGDANYGSAESVTVSFTISKAGQEIVFSEPDSQVYEPDRQVTLTASTSSGLPLTFGSETLSVCTVEGNVATIKSTGTCTIIVSQEGDGNYESGSVSGGFEITIASQEISFEPPPSQVYEADKLVALSAKATSGLDVSFTSLSTDVCTVSGSNAVIKKAGTCQISASQTGDGNYGAAASVTKSFTITAASQVITFTPPDDQTFVPEKTVALSAKSTSGLVVAFASTTPDVCMVSGTNAIINAAGDCTITASQDGDGNYGAADPVSGTFSIGKGAQSELNVSAEPEGISVGDTSKLSAEGGSGDGAVTFEIESGGEFCTIKDNVVTGTGVGTCVVRAGKAGDGNYEAVSATVKIAVGAPTIVIAPPALPAAKGGQSYAQKITASGGTAPYVFALAGSGTAKAAPTLGTLPAGLTLAADGTLSGTPTAYGIFKFVVTATDKNGFEQTKDYQLTVAAPVLAMSVGALPKGVDGSPYPSVPLRVSGGSGPYTFAVTSGALPPGLTLSPSGVLSGTPEGSGTFTFAITVTDAGGATASQTMAILVRAPAAPPAPVIAVAPASVAEGDMGVDYAQTFTASGGTAPYTFRISAGALPSGLTLAASGALSGTPSAHGNFTFTVEAKDRDGFTGRRAYTLAIRTSFVERRTGEVNRNFMTRRADIITAQGPSRLQNFRRFGNGDGSGPQMAGGSNVPFNVGVAGGEDSGATKFSFATSLQQMLQAGRYTKNDPNRMALGGADSSYSTATSGQRFDVWMEGQLTHFDGDKTQSSGDLSMLYAGADYLITPDLLIGALVQFDRVSDRSSTFGSEVTGSGWMAGPYMAARLMPNLFFDARVLWGRSQNDTSPFGTYTDSFETSRWLARADLTGNWEFDAWRFTPTAGVTYYEDRQEAYVDSNSVAIDGQTVSLGRFNFGPEIGYRIKAADGSTIEPFAGIQAIWDFDQSETSINGATPGDGAVRGKVEAGLVVTSPWGASLRGAASYDGIGASDFSAVSGQLWLNLPLN